MGLQHFGSSLLDPVLFSMGSRVALSTLHTGEFLDVTDVTAMLLVCEDLLPLGLHLQSADACFFVGNDSLGGFLRFKS